MRVLLDTHIFLWLQTAPERLGDHLGLAENPTTELLVSAVTSWEIAIKYALGRLDLPEPPSRYVPDRISRISGTPIPVEHHDTLAVADLPLNHRDPFDRLLVAQARHLSVPLLTADATVSAYPVDTLLVGDHDPGR